MDSVVAGEVPVVAAVVPGDVPMGKMVWEGDSLPPPIEDPFPSA